MTGQYHNCILSMMGSENGMLYPQKLTFRNIQVSKQLGIENSDAN